jgi:anti-anti-sigma factor
MLKVNITKLGNLSVLCVAGKIVRGETDALHNAVLAQVDAGVIVLDLAGVNTIDAGGLGLMLELRAQTEAKGIEFRLENVTKLVRRILEITKLDSVFKISGNDRHGVAVHIDSPIDSPTPRVGFRGVSPTDGSCWREASLRSSLALLWRTGGSAMKYALFTPPDANHALPRT